MTSCPYPTRMSSTTSLKDFRRGHNNLKRMNYTFQIRASGTERRKENQVCMFRTLFEYFLDCGMRIREHSPLHFSLLLSHTCVFTFKNTPFERPPPFSVISPAPHFCMLGFFSASPLQVDHQLWWRQTQPSQNTPQHDTQTSARTKRRDKLETTGAGNNNSDRGM